MTDHSVVLHPNNQKMLFSIAYLRTIVAVAGCQVSGTPEVDDQSIDVTIIGYGTSRRQRPRLDIQLKCTSREDIFREDHISYSLEKKNYNDLCSEGHIPIILLVVIVPDSPEEWLDYSSQDQLILRRCGYWKSLYNERPIRVASKVVHIPYSNQFTPPVLREIMQNISTGAMR